MPKGVVTDEFGVELAIEHNVGKLVEVRFPDRGRRNGNVKIIVPGLNFDQLPAFDTREVALVEDLEVLAEKLKAAKKQAMDEAVTDGKSPEEVAAALADACVWVGYRVHVVRDDKKVAKEIPFNEVPSDAEHRHKRLVAIAEDRTEACQALLRQAEFECKAGRLGALPTGQANQPVPNVPNQAEPLRSGGGQSDTYAFTAIVGMVTWAFELYQQSGQTFYARHVRHLADRLAFCADEMQRHLTGLKQPNRNANSHVRVRGVLHTVIERRLPPPIGDDSAEEWNRWEADVIKTGNGLLDIAKALHGEHLESKKAAPANRPQEAPADAEQANG
jgi:hypothetical protein